MTKLAERAFVPFTKETKPLVGAALEALAAELGGGWEVVEGHHLEKRYAFEDFVEALAFTNRVGALAELLNHHPDIELAWGRVKLRIWSHDAGGLTVSDFIWAAKADELVSSGV